jgi:DNA-binding CsgD family transcriptional regulator
MKTSILAYGLAAAGGAVLLQWVEYRHAVRVFSTPIFVVLVALLFTALGIWMGHRLTGRPPSRPFERNDSAMAYLGISDREYEVLELLARGHSNREIAKALFVSPNTVKSHVRRLYEKLDVSRRTQAVDKARSLRMIP